MIACTRTNCPHTVLDARQIVYAESFPYCSQECADLDSENREKYPKLNLSLDPDNIIAELNIQCAGYLYLSYNLKDAQQLAIEALWKLIGDRKITTVQVPTVTELSPELIAQGDYGFRLESAE